MKKRVAKLIAQQLQSADSSNYTVLEAIESGPLSDFHQWADDRPAQGAFKVRQGSIGPVYWIGLIDWKRNDNYYVIVFPETRKEVFAEVHRTTEGNDFLNWRYSPKKQDKRNDERKAHFAEFNNGRLEFDIPVPHTAGSVDSFLDELFALADLRIKSDNLDPNTQKRPEPREFPEGKRVEQKHCRRERNRQLVALAKKRALEHHGRLQCECCGFDFLETYGSIGEGFIEAHHTKPLSSLDEDGGETRVEDLALVCSNCHRMLHRKRPWLSMDDLEQLLSKSSV